MDFDIQDKIYVNYIIKEYADGQLVQTINLKESFQEAIKLYGKDILPALDKEGEHIIRIYFKKKDQGVLLRIGINNNFQEFDFNDLSLGRYGSRAFDNHLKDLNDRKRLLAYYGNNPSNKTTEAMHCAMEDTNETLA